MLSSYKISPLIRLLGVFIVCISAHEPMMGDGKHPWKPRQLRQDLSVGAYMDGLPSPGAAGTRGHREHLVLSVRTHRATAPLDLQYLERETKT